MPRKRMTQSGDDAQDIGSVPGQRYGEGAEQQAMQQAMPAPDKMSAPLAASTMGEGVAPVPPAGNDPQAVMQFLAQNNPNLLSATRNPDEPITAGLPMGPGPGPESLQMLQSTTPLARTLRTLSERSGDPTFRRLAERAGL